MDAEDLTPSGLIGNTDHDLAVEAAGSPQRLVDRLGPIRRSDHHRILSRLHAVEQSQQLRHQPLFRLARDLAPLGRNRIDLIDEDDRWRVRSSLLEYLAQSSLALAIG